MSKTQQTVDVVSYSGGWILVVNGRISTYFFKTFSEAHIFAATVRS
jgi:hypothetical protein